MASLALSMEMIINLFCDDFADAGDALKVGEPGGRDGTRRPEMVQEGALACGADAGDLVERRGTDGPRSLAAMGADGEAMRLVAQPLEEIKNRILGIEA